MVSDISPEHFETVSWPPVAGQCWSARRAVLGLRRRATQRSVTEPARRPDAANHSVRPAEPRSVEFQEPSTAVLVLQNVRRTGRSVTAPPPTPPTFQHGYHV